MLLLVEDVECFGHVADINAGSHGARVDGERRPGMVVRDQALAQEIVYGLAQALAGLAASLIDRLLDVGLEIDRCPHDSQYAS